MRKRLVRAVVITIVSALAVVLLAVLAGSESGHSDVSYRSLDYDATILANGDLKVVQHIDYKLDSRTNEDGDTQYWRQLYWQYTLDSTQLTNITDISVKNVTTGAVYHQINPAEPEQRRRGHLGFEICGPLVYRRCDGRKQQSGVLRPADGRP